MSDHAEIDSLLKEAALNLLDDSKPDNDEDDASDDGSIVLDGTWESDGGPMAVIPGPADPIRVFTGGDDHHESESEYVLPMDDEYDDLSRLPVGVGRSLNEALVDIGTDLKQPGKDYVSTLWEDEDPETMEYIDEALGVSSKQQGKRKRAGRRRRKAMDLPPDLHSALGSANSAFARRDMKRAIELCHTVLRQEPRSAYAWTTLAQMLGDVGEKEKELHARLVAVHLKPDLDEWKHISVLANELGDDEQALYALEQALKKAPYDIQALWDRSHLLVKLEEPEKAIECFRKLLHVVPNNVDIIKVLAKLYAQVGDSKSMLPLYESAFKADATLPLALEEAQNEYDDDDLDDFIGKPSADSNDEQVIGEIVMGARVTVKTRVGYEELLQMAEAYIEMRDYEKCIAVIKEGARRIQDREQETFLEEWEENDEEFDDDEEHYLPLELRTKLGICRLWLDNFEVAQAHFAYLYESPLSEYRELFYDVIDAYVGKRMYQTALDVCYYLEEDDSAHSAAAWALMGYCHQQLKTDDYDRAILYYNKVLNVDPQNIEVKAQLSQIYEERGDEDATIRLRREVEALEEASAAIARQSSRPKSSSRRSYGGAERAFNLRSKSISRPIEKAQKVAKLEIEYKNRSIENQSKYQAMLEHETEQYNKIQRNEFLRCARKLVQSFQETKEFYPSDRNKSFVGTRWNKDSSGANFEGYLGLRFSQWLEVFEKYARNLTLDGRHEEAFHSLKSALDSCVFWSDLVWRNQLRLHIMTSALYAGNLIRVTEYLRGIESDFRLSDGVYKLYNAIFNGNTNSLHLYASGTAQKLFLRNIRDMEAKQQPSAIVYTLYGHILSCGRSYTDAIGLYLKAYKLCPSDPITNLCLGISHIHRALQRKTDNRHLNIAQGFAFLFQYADLRGDTQEVFYNIARAYHHIGVWHLALKYYDRVLSLASEQMAQDSSADEDSLAKEAAYNCAMLHYSKGNPALAQFYMSKHCRF
ncbi:uncharacterized protein BJ171DRAFT_494333 [Polychytrium aggregatum]|uniref:uncharacterized protein n=1 Tax=Polychytrium aggregatum TaxID=110093 RepID=UPI0022FDEFC6|nr:uncharacterized protein BJ171DRAFT_494333 [Polychytrium aggregatum]KAI9207344.1 hypothetical protein BJ171DRAFT_494333 [Polychytrium aggregatum]